MNLSDKKKVLQAAQSIINMYKTCDVEAKSLIDIRQRAWHLRADKQAYRDSLEVMKRAELIKDYNLETYTIEMPL